VRSQTYHYLVDHALHELLTGLRHLVSPKPLSSTNGITYENSAAKRRTLRWTIRWAAYNLVPDAMNIHATNVALRAALPRSSSAGALPHRAPLLPKHARAATGRRKTKTSSPPCAFRTSPHWHSDACGLRARTLLRHARFTFRSGNATRAGEALTLFAPHCGATYDLSARSATLLRLRHTACYLPHRKRLPRCPYLPHTRSDYHHDSPAAVFTCAHQPCRCHISPRAHHGGTRSVCKRGRQRARYTRHCTGLNMFAGWRADSARGFTILP